MVRVSEGLHVEKTEKTPRFEFISSSGRPPDFSDKNWNHRLAENLSVWLKIYSYNCEREAADKNILEITGEQEKGCVGREKPHLCPSKL